MNKIITIALSTILSGTIICQETPAKENVVREESEWLTIRLKSGTTWEMPLAFKLNK